jgi:hypothetical protein
MERIGMRGYDDRSGPLFSYIDLEKRTRIRLWAGRLGRVASHCQTHQMIDTEPVPATRMRLLCTLL